ncbi:hypothetical protein SNOG_10698 [Parastagonospora nodorum SN15]|uniref:Uncharacterized protein n=1 Tax=Phaeosphaeria nodorum (strain SN15 / ATCC MYA-4574 / FGSC 10173) TaxID=321614 RepID=Q0UC16_PHANO|nr:hypothetical protein SNOG_10698 [Parastagonospora nodorum SN15]EAT82092.1 hypothetical protein SNOG_10698 [Parastagonospora nodorum SN15]
MIFVPTQDDTKTSGLPVDTFRFIEDHPRIPSARSGHIPSVSATCASAKMRA